MGSLAGASNFKTGFKRLPLGQKDSEKLDSDHIKTYQIRGHYAIEIAHIFMPFSLDSNLCYVVIDLSSNKDFIWMGKHADSSLRSRAEKAAQLLGEQLRSKQFHGNDQVASSVPPSASVLQEGKEDQKFWDLFPRVNSVGIELPLRYCDYPVERASLKLFQCSLASGKFTASLVTDFSQSDLDSSDLFILDDLPRKLFVWSGRRSSEKEKQKTVEVALEYVKAKLPLINASVSLEEQLKHTQLLFVVQDEEPVSFTSYFPSWVPHHTLHVATWIEKFWLADPERIVKLQSVADQYHRTYSLQELQLRPVHLDTTQYEMYLSNADFEETFKVSKEEWPSLPAWKRNGLKRNLGIF